MKSSDCNCQQKVVWLDTVSDSGLTMSTPTIEREGILLGMQLLPVGPNGSMILMCFVRRLNDNNINILNAQEIRFKD